MLSVWHKADIYRIPIYAPVTLRLVPLVRPAQPVRLVPPACTQGSALRTREGVLFVSHGLIVRAGYWDSGKLLLACSEHDWDRV